MSIVYCSNCHKNIDTDFEAEHFPCSGEKECFVCGYIGNVLPNPDGDVVCPECGDPDMGDKEEK